MIRVVEGIDSEHSNPEPHTRETHLTPSLSNSSSLVSLSDYAEQDPAAGVEGSHTPDEKSTV